MATTEMQRAAAAIAAAGRIGTIGHIGPDGDAIGSSWGLALAARAAGKEAVASFGEPFVVPKQFRFLPHDVLVSPAEFPADLDVVIACDTANPERLGELAAAAESAGTLVVLDHHVSNGGFGDVMVVDPAAAATTQLAFYLLRELGWDLTPEVAACLYTGLVTDTGRFQYSSTTPEVHRVAAALVAAGAVPDDVGRYVYGEAPFGYLRLVGAVMSRAELDEGRSLVWSVLYQDDLDACGIEYQDADALIDVLRTAEEAGVACLLKRLNERETRGSLRSRGEIDVNAIARNLGGGGHHNAAGFTHAGSPEEAIERVTAALDAIRS